MKSITPEVSSQLLPEAEIEKIPLSEFLKVFKGRDLFLKVVEEAREVARRRGYFLYFAGGVVRDYYLNASTHDLDLVLQGDLFSFLEELLKRLPGKVLFKSQFLTAKVEFGKGEEKILVDFITARKERYEEISALPKVSPASFLEDIRRRDFTINSMIYGLTPPFEEMVIDLFKGRADLKEGVIRPLKLNSFVEDPTRAFRGVRYKVRFGFRYGEEFFKALEEAFEKRAFLRLSGNRLAQELWNYLKKEPIQNLERLLGDTFELGIFNACGLEVSAKELKGIATFFREFKSEFEEREMRKAYLICFLREDLRDAERLGFAEKEVERLRSAVERLSFHLERARDTFTRLSLFERVPIVLLPFLAVRKGLDQEVSAFFKKYRKIKPCLNGEDLKRLGVPEGKALGECLRLIKKEIFEGRLKGRKDEELFVKRLLKNGYFSIKI